MILNDIMHNRAVCVIDPSGDLIGNFHQLKTGEPLGCLLSYLPQSRIKDVVYFDTSMPVALDFFSCKDAIEKKELIGEIVDIFDLEGAPVAKPFLMKLLYTLLEAKDNACECSFLDISRMLTNPKRMEHILSACSEERRQEYPPHARLPQSDTINAIVSRMIPFVESPNFRTILGSTSGGINIGDMMEGNKIFLVNLDESKEDLFIGSLIASKLQLATFRRRDILFRRRVPYYLYIDECDIILKYAKEKFNEILLRARKYKLCMTIANPVPSDLPPSIQRKFGIIRNKVIFNLNEKDAHIFQSELLPTFGPPNVSALRPFQAILHTGNAATRVKTRSFLRPRHAPYAESIRNQTIDAYPCKSEARPDNPDSGKPEPDGTLLSDEAQATGSQPARSVLRPAEQRPRAASPKPRPDPNRHSNDKPDP
jgi:hypothetical protein